MFMLDGIRHTCTCTSAASSAVNVDTTTDPNETAKDMIESYKRECVFLKIRPISKLLEQLEVGVT